MPYVTIHHKFRELCNTALIMKEKNLPVVDTRYWIAMLTASLVGTTLGDFISNSLHFGYIKGLLPLGIALAAIFAVERITNWASQTYYWLAIVLTRTMATNLADLATHRLKLNYAWIEIVLFGILIAVFLVHRSGHESPTASSDSKLPKNDFAYWLMVLIASTIGTTLGDFISDDMGLGVARASLIMAFVLAGAFLIQTKLNWFGKPAYWLLLIVVRTTGTVVGDFLSGDDGLKLGFLVSAAASALFLAVLLTLWKSASASKTQMRNEA
jgi:uncharacterized membrane-anchored protein